MAGWFTLGAAAIGAGSGILGGILGGKKEKKQQRAAQAFEAQRIRMMANDAKLAGIHPLAAMGVASSYQNPAMMVSSGGMANGVAQAGRSIADGITDYANIKRESKEKLAQTAMVQRQLDRDDRVAAASIIKMNAEAKEAEARANLAVATQNQMRIDAAAQLRNPPGGYSGTGGQYRGSTDPDKVITEGGEKFFVREPVQEYLQPKDGDGKPLARAVIRAPNQLDTQSWQGAYGELGEWISGAFNVGNEMAFRLGRYAAQGLKNMGDRKRQNELRYRRYQFRRWSAGKGPRPSWLPEGFQIKEAPFGKD